MLLQSNGAGSVRIHSSSMAEPIPMHLLFSDIAHAISNFFQICHLNILAYVELFRYIVTPLANFPGYLIQPSKTTSHKLNRQISTIQVSLVYICDFQFTTRAWSEYFSNFYYIIIVEIERPVTA